MSLSCECDYDSEGWFYYPPDDYSFAPNGRRKRCCSCDNLIDAGSIVGRFNRARYARDDIEMAIHGEGCEIDLAPYFMCEECTDLFFSLKELGFCVNIGGESMRELVAEYAALAESMRPL